MSAAAARQLLLLRPVDWYQSGDTFGEYLGGGVTIDEQRAVLRLDLGSVTWRLQKMMRLIAAMKDVEGTDTLVHREPTYDAWYATGTFFIEPCRWAYVGAGPMFNVETCTYARPAHVGPDVPTANDVREWNGAGPVARAARLSNDGVWLEIDTVRGQGFRCEIWAHPDTMRWSDEVLATMALADGGATLEFTSEGRQHGIDVEDLYEARGK